MHRPSFKISFILLLFIYILSLSSDSHAIDLLITNDTGTQGKGNFQIEINSEFAHDSENGDKADAFELSPILSYGLTNTVDVVLGIPYQFIRVKESGQTDTANGISDISVEFKWRFYEKDGLSFALKPGITLPTGDYDKGLGSGRATYSAFFITTKELDPWAFHLNLGYTRNENKADERKDLWHGSLTAVYSLTEKIRLVGNTGIERNTDRNVNTNPAYVLGGLIYSGLENIDIYAGPKVALNKPETDYSVLAGLAWKF